MQNSKGFTLIEFMIVVFILCTLAAVVIPNIIAYKRNGGAEKFDRISVAVKEKAEKAVEYVDKKIDKLNEETGIENQIAIKCINGKMCLIIEENTYVLGELDDWGDLNPITCEVPK